MNAYYAKRTADDVLLDYFSLLEAEYRDADNFLDEEEAGILKAYYPGMAELLKDESTRVIHERRLVRSGVRKVVEDLLSSAADGVSLLDAGCGLGTESLLYSMLGAKVTSVDLRDSRIKIAQKRQARFERLLGVTLDADFRQGSVFSLGDQSQFDRIWISEAISHIDPAEDFLDMTHKLLKPGGLLYVADSNGFFIPNQLKQLRERGLTIHTTMSVGEGGEEVPYAVERIVRPGHICSVIRKCGFRVDYVESHLIWRNRFGDALFRRVYLPIERLPLLGTILGRTYLVIGRKSLG